MEYARIIGGKLIQLNDVQVDNYKPIIEETKPEEKEGFYIAYNYEIVGTDEVHKTYHYEEVVVEEEKLME